MGQHQRAGDHMKRLIAGTVIVVAVLTLAGCDDVKPQMTTDEKFIACVEAGGSFEYDGAWGGYKCTVPAQGEGSGR